MKRRSNKYGESPSSRRAWIEIRVRRWKNCKNGVALLAEGVDRNQHKSTGEWDTKKSPSSRRAWIEITTQPQNRRMKRSPSSRRAWIEIDRGMRGNWKFMSPSSRRAWIEIPHVTFCFYGMEVALLAEGVDRNHHSQQVRLPQRPSPSSRRAWIEIFRFCGSDHACSGRPPRGGRG